MKGAISRINVFSPLAHWRVAGRMTGQTDRAVGADLVRACPVSWTGAANVGTGRADRQPGAAPVLA